MSYNVRGQMTDMQLGSGTGTEAFNRGRIANYYSNNFTPNGSGTDNNGNLLRQENYVPAYAGVTGATNFQQSYAYDELNRLTDVEEKFNGTGGVQWRQKFAYDRWGNRTFNQQHTWGWGVPKPDFTCDTTTNRLLPGATMAGQMVYDQAGNLTTDTATGAGGRVFDAENRMISAQATLNGGNFQQQYTYDGDGRRIIRGGTISYGGGTWQVYGFDGELLAEYAANSLKILPQKEYGYVGGKLLITANGGDDNRLRRFVENLYYRTWGYLPAGKGQTQINQIVTALGVNGQANTGAMLQAAKDLAAGLFDSSQYANVTRTNEQYVADLYLAYLQRAPEPGAIAWYAGFLNNGQLTRLQLRQEFANGPEFAWIVNTLYGNQSGDYDRVDRLINQIYTAATGHLPSGGQYTFERNRFDTAEAKGLSDTKEAGKELGRYLLGATPHNYNGDNIINAPYRSDLSTTEYVTRLYETFLRRAPDANFSNYVTQADAPNGRHTVLEQFLAMSAFSERSGALYREIFWLISDHLGTPRMIAERTGKLEGIKRSDYLPFGEEISIGVSGRATGQGYVDDSVRQQFTSYERDDETGLDYAKERYYSNAMGRFISVDPLGASADVKDPQTMNRYVYVLNNPLRYIDPDGMKEKDPWEQLSKEEQEAISGKLVLKNKKDTPAAAFNRLVLTAGQKPEEIAKNLASIQNFIAGAGGLSNSAVWQQIASVDSIGLHGGDSSSNINLTVNNVADFTKALASEGYLVNHPDEKYSGEKRLDSARQLTDNSNNPALHFERRKEGANFSAHWDISSTHFANVQQNFSIPATIVCSGNYACGQAAGRRAEQAYAGWMHRYDSPSPDTVRQYLKRKGIVPNQ